MSAAPPLRHMLAVPMTGYLGMDLPGFLALVRARGRLIAGIVVAAVLLALLVSLLQPSRYRATADLLFADSPAADVIAAGDLTAAADDVPERVAATNLALASLDGIAVRVKRQLGASSSAEELRDAVEVATRGDSDLGTVTAEWDSPEQAAAVANAFATQIVAVRRESAQADIQRAIDALNRVVAAQPPAAEGAPADPSARALRDRIAQLEALKALETGGVSVVEQATPPRERSAPRPLRNALIAGLLALVLAVFAVVLLARLEERIADEEQLAALVGAPILARIPQLPRSRPFAPTAAASQDPAFLEAFEFLRLNLELRRADTLGRPADGSVVFAVTSPKPDEGKTTVVSWLARAIGAGGGDVVAVDLDVRKPELHQFLSTFGPADGVLEPDRDDAGADPLVEPQPGAGRRAYAEDDIAASLTELVLSRGNARRAARSLKSAGLDISESTLRRWKVMHASLYDEIEAANALQAAARYETNATLLRGVRLFTAADEPALATNPGARERLRELFAELRMRAGYVLVDAVPVATVADASAIAAEADGVILVVDLARLRRRDLLATKRQLDNARADVIGIVLNRSAVELSAYDAPANGAGSLARQLADSSRATLRRVTRPQRTPGSGSSSWIASLRGQRDEPPDRG
jgi:Mrp family chromosome partitioning ATPase/capsular polysaccharide biosynthesis protein